MTHILVECPEFIVSAKLGVMDSLAPLVNKGKCETRFRRTADVKKGDIVWADILITVRGCESLTLDIVTEAKKTGRLIIYYLDDDLLNIPSESQSSAYFNDIQINSNIKKLLTLSDILWGVNPNIRDKYLPLTRSRWIQNKLPITLPKWPFLAQPSGAPLKILYAGSTDHQNMIQEILTPVIEKLCIEYQGHVDFTFIGADPKLPQYMNVHFIPFIKPYEAYRSYVENGNFSIALAPVRISAFHACKYYNKFVEYVSIGAVGVYTDAEPYTFIVRNGQNGILCDNTPDGWYFAIKKLLSDNVLRKKLLAKSQKQLLEEFAPETVTREIVKQCPELCQYAAPHISASAIHLHNGFFSFYWERVVLLWRQRGIAGIPSIIYKTVKVLR